jgi:2-dehydropantoate 2-reductase
MVGVGAVGGYIGGRMVHAGEDVTFVGMWPPHVELLRTRGLELSGTTPAESLTVPVSVLNLGEVQSLAKTGPVDIAFIAVKSYDTPWATALIAPYLSRDGFVVSLQNCINEERIADIVGWGRTAGVIVTRIGVEMWNAGHVKRMMPISGERYTVFRVGEVHGRVTPRAEKVAELLRHCDSARVTSNLWGERWSKLIVNAMRNGLPAATGISGKDRDLNPATRKISIRLAAEAIRVAQALGYQLESMQRMDPERLARAGEGDAEAAAEIDRILVENAHMRHDEQQPSTAQDIAKGRRTEIDDINGYVAAKGDAAGVPAPTHRKLNEIVRRVERGELEAALENLKLLD